MDCSSFWNFIAQVKDAYYVHKKQIMEKFSLSAIEVDVLLFIINNPAMNTASQIVNLRKASKSHVSLAVKALTAKGYLCTGREPGNRKNIYLYPTASAAEFAAFSQAEQACFVKNITAGITEEEKEAFRSCAGKVCRNIEQNYSQHISATTKE